MVLGSEAVGRWLSPEGGAFMNEISVLIKETPENQLTASSTWGSREICGLGEGTHRSWWHLRLPGSRMVRNKFAYKPPGLWHLCSRGPDRPKQLYILFFFNFKYNLFLDSNILSTELSTQWWLLLFESFLVGTVYQLIIQASPNALTWPIWVGKAIYPQT